MSDDLLIAGKTYVPSKSAATHTGYAQDYIGQLARSGQIDAQRVGGLWYVHLDSLTGYKTKSAEIKPQPPTVQPAHDPESVVSFDGKDYVSASRAAKITGYNQDYIGQLARSGKILSRQIGNRWYVERSGLVNHKTEKDRLLGAVQSESVGLLWRPVESTVAPLPIVSSAPVKEAPRREYADASPVMTYFSDDKRDLMPLVEKKNTPIASPIAIRTLKTIPSPQQLRLQPKKVTLEDLDDVRISEKKSRLPSTQVVTRSLMTLTIVVVLSYGLFSLKDGSTYAFFAPGDGTTTDQNRYAATAAGAIDQFTAYLERLLTKELIYTR